MLLLLQFADPSFTASSTIDFIFVVFAGAAERPRSAAQKALTELQVTKNSRALFGSASG